MQDINNVGLSNFTDLFLYSLMQIKSGIGSIICIEGETSFGKTHLLNIYNQLAQDKAYNVLPVFVDNQAPIGNFQVGNIQPLLPFSRAIEKIIESKSISAERKFALNLGITLLASLPFAGEVFYAAKEIARDYRQFKKEKSSESFVKVSTATADYYDTLLSYSEKIPLVIMIDDMQWCDAQSIELLNLLSENIKETPIIIAFSYKKSVLRQYASPLQFYLDNHLNKTERVFEVKLEQFDSEQINTLSMMYIRNYRDNKKFEHWLYEKSFGVPGVVIEYLKYFNQNPPFKPDGTLIENFSENASIPSTLMNVFQQILEKINDDEKNMLSICSSEGREFTVSIVSQLLNTDFLTSIKKLRVIQNKTGLIKSKGTAIRYGTKTTVYEFTQAYYYQYFQSILEYEEHIALHQKISELLKQKYDEAVSEAIKQDIAPYLAAHSSEAEDNDTAKSMLLVSAQTAQQFGSSDIVQNAYNDFMNISNPQSEKTENPLEIKENFAFQEIFRNISAQTGEPPAYPPEMQMQMQEQTATSYPIDMNFDSIRSNLINDYYQQNYHYVAENSLNHFNTNNQELNIQEQAQLVAFAIRAYIEMQDFKTAEHYMNIAIELVKSHSDPIAECFVLNVCSLLRSQQNSNDEAFELLLKAAKKALYLPPEMQLMTLSNITILLDKYQPEQAGKYRKAVLKLTKTLNFNEITKDIIGHN